MCRTSNRVFIGGREKKRRSEDGGRGGGDTHKKLVSLGNFLFLWKQLLLERENLLGGTIPGLSFILGEVSLYFCCIGVVLGCSSLDSSFHFHFLSRSRVAVPRILRYSQAPCSIVTKYLLSFTLTSCTV